MWQVLAYTLAGLTLAGVFFAIRAELRRHREEMRQRRLRYWRGVDRPPARKPVSEWDA